MPSFVMFTAVAVLAAADVPLPAELTALALVAVVLRWFIVRDNQADRDRDARLIALEAKADEQRHLKHMVLNQLARIVPSLALIQVASERCTCGAMTQVLPLIENLLTAEQEKPPT